MTRPWLTIKEKLISAGLILSQAEGQAIPDSFPPKLHQSKLSATTHNCASRTSGLHKLVRFNV